MQASKNGQLYISGYFNDPSTILDSISLSNWGILGTHNAWLAKTQKDAWLTGEKDILGPKDDILLYPNPNHGQFYLQASFEIGALIFSLYDMQGRLMWHKEEIVNQSTRQYFIDLPSLELGPGLYVFRWRNGTKQHQSRIYITQP